MKERVFIFVAVVLVGLFSVFSSSFLRLTCAEAETVEPGGVTATLPDLVVSSLKAPAAVPPGGTIQVADTTSNSGDATAGSSRTNFYLSVDASVGSGDVLLGGRKVASLSGGQGSSGTRRLAIPEETTPGPYYIIAVCDDLKTIKELREGNNKKTRLIHVDRPPTADAGDDKNAVKGSVVTLDGGNSSDPDKDTLTYEWSFVSKPAGSAAAFSSPSAKSPTFTPDKEGVYVVKLVVNDGKLDSSADRVTVSTTFCRNDYVSGIPASGSLTVGPSWDFVPLCNGWVLLGDRSSNKIRSINAISGTEGGAFQLSASPGDLEADPVNGLLYVTQAPTNNVTRIDLAASVQTPINIGCKPLYMAGGNGGRLFATCDNGSSYHPVALIDGPGGNLVKTFAGIDESFLVYDKAGNQLIGGVQGMSPSSLTRYAFNASKLTLTETQNLWDAGSNGEDLAISPDGNHIAFSCGGGNGAGYTIFDFSSDDLTAIYGEWNTGAYPNAAAFDPTGRYLVATNDETIQVFDVLTHVKIREYAIDMGDCGFGYPWRMGFSRGGKIVYGLANCGYSSDHAKLFWAVFAP